MPPVTVNLVSIKRKFDAAIKSGVKKKEIDFILKQKATDGAYEVAAKLTEEFNAHPATLELLSGPDARSSFLPDGNLASFYGLETSRINSDVTKFRELFKEFIVTVKHDGSNFTVNVKFPAVSRFYKEAEAPDEYGGSWLAKMEVIGGFAKTFSKYLYPFHGDESRSGSGIQSRYVIHKNADITIGSIPYITEIYQKVLEDVGIGKAIIARRVNRKAV